ncbi:MAG: YesL family protein [Oscillospiraceae bacterium]
MHAQSVGSALMRFLEAFADLCIVSAYWIVCCVPIITIGASSAALYSTVVRVVRDESGSLSKTYFSVFCKAFRQGIVCSLIFAAGCVLFALYYLLGVDGISGGLFIAYWAVVVLLWIIFTGVFLYVFPLLSRFRQNNAVMLRNAFLLAAGYPAKTLGLACLAALVLLALLHAPLLILILPGTFAFLASLVEEPILKKHGGDGNN